MAEVPEHLLQRAKARRAAMSGEAAPAPTPATTAEKPVAAAAAAAAAPAAPAPKKAAPEAPWVQAAKSSPKLPIWAASMMALLPIWTIFYMTTNDPPSAKKLGPAEIGASTYSACAGCHGAAGGGSGAFPALTNVATVFPTPWEQVRWVMLGTEGFQKEGLATYGATNKAVKGSGNNMPPQLETLTAENLLAVVRHERTVFGKEKFDIKAWEEIPTKMAADGNSAISAKAAAYKTVIDEWKAAGA